MRPSPSSAVTGKAELLEQGALSALPGGGEKADQAPLPLFPAARVGAHGSKRCSSNARNCSMPKAAVQDQAHSAAICPLPLASLDHRGLGNVCPDFTRTLVCGSGKIRADSGQSPGGGAGVFFLLPLGEGRQSHSPSDSPLYQHRFRQCCFPGPQG